MNSRTDQVDAGAGRHFAAYVSLPRQPNGHAVVVLQEIFGVTPHIRGIADRFAEDGYLALAPDLFWRVKPGMSLTHSREDMARAFALVQQYDELHGVEDIASCIAHVRRQPEFRGKVAVAGMCLAASWPTWLRHGAWGRLRWPSTASASRRTCTRPTASAAR